MSLTQALAGSHATSWRRLVHDAAAVVVASTEEDPGLAGHVAGVRGVALVLPPEFGPSRPLRQVVVGVDGSPEAEEAAAYAAGISIDLDIPLLAVLLWNPAGLTSAITKADPGDTAEVLGRLRGSVDASLSEETESAVRTAVEVGDPAATLARCTGTDDLIVLGTRGLGGGPGIHLGSVTRAVIAAPPCPVAVVSDAEPLTRSMYESKTRST